MPIRIQLSDENLTALLHTGSLPISALPSRVRSSMYAYAIQSGIPLRADGSQPDAKEVAILAQGLPPNPTIAEWAQMSKDQRETYPDEIFWSMDAQII